MPKKTLSDQLTDYFSEQPPEQVAQWLAATIVADRGLKKVWQARMLLSGGKPGDFKKLLTKALPKKELLVTPNLWRKVGHYFYEAECLFDMAFSQIDALNDDQQFQWLMQAFERLNMVVQTIDDSGGYRLGLVHELGERLVASFHQKPWSVEKKAAWLVEHQFKYDVFPYIPADFNLPDDLAQAFEKAVSRPKAKKGKVPPDNISHALMDALNAKKP